MWRANITDIPERLYKNIYSYSLHGMVHRPRDNFIFTLTTRIVEILKYFVKYYNWDKLVYIRILRSYIAQAMS